jgi:hypothetical protein
MSAFHIAREKRGKGDGVRIRGPAYIKMPQVIAHCCSDTTLPRISFGAISL